MNYLPVFFWQAHDGGENPAFRLCLEIYLTGVFLQTDFLLYPGGKAYSFALVDGYPDEPVSKVFFVFEVFAAAGQLEKGLLYHIICLYGVFEVVEADGENIVFIFLVDRFQTVHVYDHVLLLFA